MSEDYARDCWRRAQEAIRVARHDLPLSPDAAASRAYYSAFHAVSALFAAQGRTFTQHRAVEAAVHRDLVKPGHWPEHLGADYMLLRELRATADYGGMEHVLPEEASDAIVAAERILNAVEDAHPPFTESDG